MGTQRTLSDSEVLARLQEADVAVFEAIAGYQSPVLDRLLPALSEVANYSRLWIGGAALLALLGGRNGRSVAAEGLVAVGLTSATANLAVKGVARRTRPTSEVPEERRLEQPASSSFPSGHTASAAAFSGIVGKRYPLLHTPLNLLAVSVGMSRVYTGVHYPGDVLAGWALGRLVSSAVWLVWPKRWAARHP